MSILGETLNVHRQIPLRILIQLCQPRDQSN